MTTATTNDAVEKTPSFNMGEYAEMVLNHNLRALCGKGKRFSQKSLMTPMGVRSEGAVSQRLNGTTHWTLISAINVARAVGKSLEELLDDSAMLRDIENQKRTAELILKLGSDTKRAGTGFGPRLFVAYADFNEYPVPRVGLEPTLYRF